MYLKIYFIFLFIILVAIIVFITINQNYELYAKEKNPRTLIASRFLLTDLCLNTESRHTRHLSQPELIAPFQDAPGYLDYFPSSTFIGVYNLESSFIQADSVGINEAKHP